ncbi:hypothetical protein DE146DRAFT_264400 [Phaeosphaeria sp. MPI-PUGE-AT-0046c]|nr:hypothetical protein DE146DRAFT_264400 [Phaeosphaeria sp. MPI-PUGE-AT-0046c]
MPTHTPSPHRFLTPKSTPLQKAKPRPQSNLRNNFAGPTPQPPIQSRHTSLIGDGQSTHATPAKRFIVAPHRRTLSTEDDTHVKERLLVTQSTPQAQLSPRPKPRRKFERIESINSASQSSPIASPADDDDNNNNDGLSVAPTVEHGHVFEDSDRAHEQDEEDDEILFVTEERNKRRRVSPPTSPSLPSTSEPTTPHAHTTHRFLVPPPRTPALFAATEQKPDNAGSAPSSVALTPASHRPAFILPPQPTSPVKPSKSLPEIFSPSRKTQKYVPNGLAATLQGWIIETANTGFAAQEWRTTGGVVWGRDKEDGVKLKFRVKEAASSSVSVHEGDVECYPGHFVFVRGETDPGLYNVSRAPSVVEDNGECRVLLAGQGGARGVGGIRLRSACVVGVRAPMWEVDVGGEKWVVGVDWALL